MNSCGVLMKLKSNWPKMLLGVLVVFVLIGNAQISSAQTELNVTLQTDENTYEKGRTMLVSGTVNDSENSPVASGTATIQVSRGDWKQKYSASISNGAYNSAIYLPYGGPTGSFTISVGAVDALGNTGSSSKDVTVNATENEIYRVLFTSPDNSINYSRGRTLTLSVTVDNDVEGATVQFNSPTGVKTPLSSVATGAYEATYTLKFDDPAETWTLWVEAIKDNDNKAGGAWINVQVVPAELSVIFKSPAGDKENVGEMTVEVEVAYPYDWGPVENASVSANDPKGGTLNLVHTGSGIYSASYNVTEPASWTISVQASDSFGNSKTDSKLVSIVVPPVPGLLEQFWWAIVSVVVAVAFVSVYAGRGKRLEAKLIDIRREIKEIPKLKKDAAIKYFKEGAISRGAYDSMMKRYDARLDELKKLESGLKGKVKNTKVKK